MAALGFKLFLQIAPRTKGLTVRPNDVRLPAEMQMTIDTAQPACLFCGASLEYTVRAPRKGRTAKRYCSTHCRREAWEERQVQKFLQRYPRLASKIGKFP